MCWKDEHAPGLATVAVVVCIATLAEVAKVECSSKLGEKCETPLKDDVNLPYTRYRNSHAS